VAGTVIANASSSFAPMQRHMNLSDLNFHMWIVPNSRYFRHLPALIHRAAAQLAPSAPPATLLIYMRRVGFACECRSEVIRFCDAVRQTLYCANIRSNEL
jgi:hypothetical protein